MLGGSSIDSHAVNDKASVCHFSKHQGLPKYIPFPICYAGNIYFCLHWILKSRIFSFEYSLIFLFWENLHVLFYQYLHYKTQSQNASCQLVKKQHRAKFLTSVCFSSCARIYRTIRLKLSLWQGNYRVHSGTRTHRLNLLGMYFKFFNVFACMSGNSVGCVDLIENSQLNAMNVFTRNATPNGVAYFNLYPNGLS